MGQALYQSALIARSGEQVYSYLMTRVLEVTKALILMNIEFNTVSTSCNISLIKSKFNPQAGYFR